MAIGVFWRLGKHWTGYGVSWTGKGVLAIQKTRDSGDLMAIILDGLQFFPASIPGRDSLRSIHAGGINVPVLEVAALLLLDPMVGWVRLDREMLNRPTSQWDIIAPDDMKTYCFGSPDSASQLLYQSN